MNPPIVQLSPHPRFHGALPWRSGAAIKANPPRGGGAKPMGLSSRREAAGLPNGGGVTTQRALKREPHPLHSKRGGALACASTLHASLIGPMVLSTMSERG